MMLTIMKRSALYVLYRIADSQPVGIFLFFPSSFIEAANLRMIWILSHSFLFFVWVFERRRIYFSPDRGAH